ncbi:MAG: hypothetical protein ACRC1R_07035 [Cetobacterium sp.]|uniref:hypothetical protein n=1 Tax=Cetobacterium sp. TaxID=2071632 RepID=UPI003F3C103B
MKKLFMFVFMFLISVFTFSKGNDEIIYNNIKSKALEQYSNYGDRQNEIELQFNAYKNIQKIISNNPQAKEIYITIENLYPREYILQYKILKEKLNEYKLYKNLKIKENKEEEIKSKLNIEKIKVEKNIPKIIMDEILKNGQKNYGEDYINLEKYIRASIENYFFIVNYNKRNIKE